MIMSQLYPFKWVGLCVTCIVDVAMQIEWHRIDLLMPLLVTDHTETFIVSFFACRN